MNSEIVFVTHNTGKIKSAEKYFKKLPAFTKFLAVVFFLVAAIGTFGVSTVLQKNDRFELIACGGLPQGLSKEEFFAGRSLPRNRELMRVMGDLDLGEHIGRGMRRIMKVLKEEDFDISENFLSVNFKFDSRALEMLDEHTKEVETINTQELTEQEQIIVDYIKQYKFIRRSTVEDILDVKKTRAYEVIASLIEKNIIKVSGNGSSSKYILV